MERHACERCDLLRQRIIQYAKLKTVENINDSDLDTGMGLQAHHAYMSAFILFLISFLCVSVAISRMEAKTPTDGERAASAPWRTGPHCPPATASPNPPSGKLGASAAENEEEREPNKRIDSDKR